MSILVFRTKFNLGSVVVDEGVEKMRVTGEERRETKLLS